MGDQGSSIAAQDTLSEFLGRACGGSCVFRPVYAPPRSVPSHGLGNRAAKLWHRTVGFSFSFLFRPADPSPIGAGGVLGILATPTVAQDCVTLFSPFRWYNFASPPLAAFVALRQFFAFPSTRFRPASPFR